MGVSAMNAIITYDCKCDYCGRKLSSSFGTYEPIITSKRQLNVRAREYGWFCDSRLKKNVCTDKRCVIARNKELNEKFNVGADIESNE